MKKDELIRAEQEFRELYQKVLTPIRDAKDEQGIQDKAVICPLMNNRDATGYIHICIKGHCALWDGFYKCCCIRALTKGLIVIPEKP